MEAEKSINNTCVLMMDTSRVLVGGKVSAAERTTEICCLHSKSEDVNFKSRLEKVQMPLFLSGSQFSRPSPADLAAASDMVDPPSLPRTLTWLGSRDTTTPGFLTSTATASRLLAGSSLSP